jgi:hypothetical protein
LVIEVDGGHHFTVVGKENDKLRDEYMKSFELTVLRFSNSEVVNNIDKVVESIRKILLYPPFRKGDNPKSIGQKPFVKKTSSSFVKEPALSEANGRSRGGFIM